MIIRRTRNKGSADGVSLSFYSEFGLPDIKRMCVDFCDNVLTAYTGIYAPPTAKEMALAALTMNEDDWRATFAAHPYFKIYPDKYSDLFAKWAFSLALKEGMIKASSAEPHKYYLSSTATTKKGRPPKAK